MRQYVTNPHSKDHVKRKTFQFGNKTLSHQVLNKTLMITATIQDDMKQPVIALDTCMQLHTYFFPWELNEPIREAYYCSFDAIWLSEALENIIFRGFCQTNCPP